MEKVYISVDIGGTGIKCGRVLSGGIIEDRIQRDTPEGTGEELLDLLADMIGTLMTKETAGIGIAALGSVDEKRGMVTGACENLPQLRLLPLKEMLEARFGLPVWVRNDVNAAALGEAFFGAGRGLSQFYCLTLGTGIGGALVVGNRVLSGANGQAGEIGYLHRTEAGCYEERASVRAFLRHCQACGDDRTDGVEVFQEALSGGKNRDIFQAWLRQVARGICEVVYLLDPGTVVIGGGVSAYGDLLCQPLTEMVDELLLPDFRGGTKVVVAAATGNNANLLGAVAGQHPEQNG